MSRLINADKIDFNEVFKGQSDFAVDTRNTAQSLIDAQQTAYNPDKVVEQLEKEFKKYYGANWNKAPYLVKAIEIVKGGGVNAYE